MKNVSKKYEESIINNEAVTLCFCLKFELKNGKKLGFTTNTKNIIFEEEPDLVYKTNSLTPTATSKTSDMSVDNLDTQLIIDYEDLSPDDLEKGVFSGAKWYYFRANYSFKEKSYSDIEKINDGIISEVSRSKGFFKIELRAKDQYLQSKINDTIKPSCSAMLYDNKCGINKNDHVFSDRINSVLTKTKFNCQNLLNQNGDFDYGIIEFLSGDAKGIKAEVKYWKLEDKSIELQIPINYNLKNGDEFQIFRGCDKSKETCKSKFNNVINFRGFPDVPGLDKVMGGGN